MLANLGIPHQSLKTLCSLIRELLLASWTWWLSQDLSLINTCFFHFQHTQAAPALALKSPCVPDPWEAGQHRTTRDQEGEDAELWFLLCAPPIKALDISSLHLPLPHFRAAVLNIPNPCIWSPECSPFTWPAYKHTLPYFSARAPSCRIQPLQSQQWFSFLLDGGEHIHGVYLIGKHLVKQQPMYKPASLYWKWDLKTTKKKRYFCT